MTVFVVYLHKAKRISDIEIVQSSKVRRAGIDKLTSVRYNISNDC